MSARTHFALRAHSSPRARSSASSSRSIGSSIIRYAHRLTSRDFQILIELHEHRVLTTSQIYELHFDTFTRASKRMLQLYRLGLIERFRPQYLLAPPPGTTPWTSPGPGWWRPAWRSTSRSSRSRRPGSSTWWPARG